MFAPAYMGHPSRTKNVVGDQNLPIRSDTAKVSDRIIGNRYCGGVAGGVFGGGAF